MAQLIELAQDVKRVMKENERLSKEVVKLKDCSFQGFIFSKPSKDDQLMRQGQQLRVVMAQVIELAQDF